MLDSESHVLFMKESAVPSSGNLTDGVLPVSLPFSELRKETVLDPSSPQSLLHSHGRGGGGGCCGRDGLLF